MKQILALIILTLSLNVHALTDAQSDQIASAVNQVNEEGEPRGEYAIDESDICENAQLIKIFKLKKACKAYKAVME